MKRVSTLKRGVSLFSYQEQFYLGKMNLEGCVAAAASAGATGIEMLVDQMVPGYPSITYNLAPHFIEEFGGIIARHGVAPIAFDIYGESKLYRNRATTDAELTAQLVELIKTGKALGFRIFRINFLVPLKVIEALVPHAEQMDVILAIEIHAPHRMSGPWVQGTLEIIERLKTKHLGLMPDFGIYCRTIPNLVLAEARRNGVHERFIRMALDAYHSPVLRAGVTERVTQAGGSPAAIWLAKRVEIGVWIDDNPRDLEKYIPYCVHAHAKFYEVTRDLVDQEVRYDEIIPILLDGGFDGYLMSEYEGQRLNQGLDPGYDEIEQVKRHQAMLTQIEERWLAPEVQGGNDNVGNVFGYGSHMIREGTLRNVMEDGKCVGFSVELRLANYRGYLLPQIEDIRLEVDGIPIPRSELSLRLADRIYRVDEMESVVDDRWGIQEVGVLICHRPNGLQSGDHLVCVEQHIRASYIPMIAVSSAEQTMQLQNH